MSRVIAGQSGFMAVAFDEMNGLGGDLRPAYQELSRWLKETPPDALEYRRQEAELLFRRIGITFAVYGDAEAQERLIPFDVIPRIMSGKEWTLLEKGPPAAGSRAEHVPARHLSRPRHPARQHHPRRPDLPEPGVPPGDERPGRAARRLCPHRRHRHHPGRRGKLHRAGGQCADAVRRVLHAGKPRNHDAAVSGPVRPPPRRAGGEISGRIAVGAAVGGPAQRLGRADGRADDARRLQLRLLRAFVPGRQARHRAGRGPRPHRQERRGVHAHHRGPETRRRDLPPRR